jgi:hypothetical protein
MTALTDRYVHAVLSAVPGRERADLEPDIRSLVADTVDARNGDERAALTELGDPAVLATRYADRPQYVIGPALYGEWRRLLSLLLPILVPIIFAVVLGSSLLGGSTVGESIVAAMASGFSVGLQTAFWVTLVFALIERFGTPGVPPRREWSVDDLPELPADGRVSVVEIGVSIAFNILVIAALLWVQLQSPIAIDGESFSLFDPALWSLWLPWFIGVTLLEIGMLVWILWRGRWTWGAAIVNAVLGAAFAIPAIYLLANDMLFNPALVAELAEIADGAWLDPTMTIIAVAGAVVTIWDAIDGFLKARRASLA